MSAKRSAIAGYWREASCRSALTCERMLLPSASIGFVPDDDCDDRGTPAAGRRRLSLKSLNTSGPNASGSERQMLESRLVTDRVRCSLPMTPLSSSARYARLFRRFSSGFSFPGMRLTTSGGRDLMMSIAASPNLSALNAMIGRDTNT